MKSSFIMLTIGLLMVFSEFFLPGGIMGTIGALFIVFSIVFFTIATENPLHLFFFFFGTVVSLACTIKVALYLVGRGKEDSSVSLLKDQEGYHSPSLNEERNALVGNEGVVLSDLKPSGFVLVKGKKYQALSLGAYIPKGTSVEVSAVQGAHLNVKPFTKDQ